MRAPRPLRRAATVLVALAAVALVGLGGSLLPAETGRFRQTPLPAVGRTATVCPSTDAANAVTSVAAVAVRAAPGRTGTLTGTTIQRARTDVAVTEQGRGSLTRVPAAPVVLRGEGVMATAGSGLSVGAAGSGELAGLLAAPCTAPGTQHWFVGVGATPGYRTEVVLSNPDDGQAEVDLRFYGGQGIVVVPGSPGLVVEGHSSRTVSLESLVRQQGPLTVEVRASEGRVAATALDRSAAGLDPTGADWQTGAVAPAGRVVVPGVPEGAGSRQLSVVNPGTERATVDVQVLGVQGGYPPAGAESLVVPPESTASVDLTAGLTGQAASVQLTSDQPVTAAVLSRSQRTGSRADLAVQPAAAPVVRTGVVPLATQTGLDSQLTLSNGGDTDVTVAFEVLSYTGVSLRSEDVLLVAHGTATRRLTSPPPSYLVVRAPAGSAVVGGVAYQQPTGAVAGLATAPVTSPDVASRAPQTRSDPGVGR